MNIVNTLFVAAGLSVDACAVALAHGLSRQGSGVRGALVVGATFGLTSGAMPFLGAAAGGLASELFMRFDHWIAFAVLALLGVKSLLEARRSRATEEREAGGYVRVFVAALATSIDTCAAGFSFELIQEPIAPLAWLTGAITALGSAASYLGATRLGRRHQRAGMVFGGIVLIAIAFRVLGEHADHL